MNKNKNKPGIHLHQTELTIMDVARGVKPVFWWVIIAKNGNIVGRSWRSYTRKAGAVKSIKTAAKIFWDNTNQYMYYDHSKKDSSLQSYL